jgi:hypothetical protein
MKQLIFSILITLLIAFSSCDFDKAINNNTGTPPLTDSLMVSLDTATIYGNTNATIDKVINIYCHPNTCRFKKLRYEIDKLETNVSDSSAMFGAGCLTLAQGDTNWKVSFDTLLIGNGQINNMINYKRTFEITETRPHELSGGMYGLLQQLPDTCYMKFKGLRIYKIE